MFPQQADEQPLVQALCEAGLDLNSVWDLVLIREPYPQAIPILVEHLDRPYSPKTKEGIARALTVEEAKGVAWCALLAEFRKETDLSHRPNDMMKFALANALSFISDEAVLDDVLELVQDQRHGDNRYILVSCLWRYDDEKVLRILEKLTGDAEEPVVKEANITLDKLQRRQNKVEWPDR